MRHCPPPPSLVPEQGAATQTASRTPARSECRVASGQQQRQQLDRAKQPGDHSTQQQGHTWQKRRSVATLTCPVSAVSTARPTSSESPSQRSTSSCGRPDPSRASTQNRTNAVVVSVGILYIMPEKAPQCVVQARVAIVQTRQRTASHLAAATEPSAAKSSQRDSPYRQRRLPRRAAGLRKGGCNGSRHSLTGNCKAFHETHLRQLGIQTAL